MKQAGNFHYQSKSILLIISSVGFSWFGVIILHYYACKLLEVASTYTYICIHPYAYMSTSCFEIKAIAETNGIKSRKRKIQKINETKK